MYKFPVMIPARAGSKRLPRKAFLPWDGMTLLQHVAAQVAACPATGEIIIAADSDELLNNAAASVPQAKFLLEPEIPDTAPGGGTTILETIRRVRKTFKLEAAYLGLAQLTSPFTNPHDLFHMFLEVVRRNQGSKEVFYTSADMYKPSGMGYVFGPWVTVWSKEVFSARCASPQAAPDVDVDTMADYQKALKLRADWDVYRMTEKGTPDAP